MIEKLNNFFFGSAKNYINNIGTKYINSVYITCMTAPNLRCPLHYRTQNLQITKEYTLLTLNIHNLFILYYLKRLKRTASLKSCDRKKRN